MGRPAGISGVIQAIDRPDYRDMVRELIAVAGEHNVMLFEGCPAAGHLEEHRRCPVYLPCNGIRRDCRLRRRIGGLSNSRIDGDGGGKHLAAFE
jgi:hypothetical protein